MKGNWILPAMGLLVVGVLVVGLFVAKPTWMRWQ